MKKALFHIVISCLGTVLFVSCSSSDAASQLVKSTSGLELAQSEATTGETSLECNRKEAETIKDAYSKAKALTEVAGKYIEAGQKDKAAEVLSQALQVAKTTNNIYLLTEIGGKYIEAGQNNKASEVLSQALQVVKTIEDASSKANALTEIAGSYAAVGQKDQASEVLSQALQLVKTIKGAEDRNVFPNSSTILQQIVGKYAAVGQYNQALQVAKTIKDAEYKVRTLVELAGSYAAVGQKNKASEILSQALQAAKTIKDADLKGTILEQISVSYAAVGQYNQALQVTRTIRDANLAYVLGADCLTYLCES